MAGHARLSLHFGLCSSCATKTSKAYDPNIILYYYICHGIVVSSVEILQTPYVIRQRH